MPKHSLPSVPSILCMQHRNPILGYSKAPWGLSVLSRVTGIFTGTTISPGGLSRQCPNHYAFHAGQNLPDKEFRYLRLEFQYRKDGIPTATPQIPKHLLPSVPSILCMQHRNPILGYSKAPWGLSVLSRVTGIFTGTTISPGGLLRQCPNHYAFHAGQNLPDKEFRYLRTVIVTAAVHWGFDSMLAHLLLTFQHRAGVSSYTSSFDLAQTCVFGKQLPGPILCGSLS